MHQLQAAKTWIDMIFQYDSSLQKPDVGIGQGGLEIFVQVFWFIHQANEDQALRYVNQERRKRGYKYCFNPQAYCNLLQNWTMRESVAREGEDIRTNSPIEDICGTDTGEVDDMLEGFQAEKENGTNESFPAPSPDRTKKRNAGSFVVRESQLGTRAISAGRPSMTVEQEERTIKKMKHPKSPSAQNVILPSISQQKNFDIDKNFGREGQGQRTTGSRAATSSHKFRKSGLDQIPSTRSFMGQSFNVMMR